MHIEILDIIVLEIAHHHETWSLQSNTAAGSCTVATVCSAVAPTQLQLLPDYSNNLQFQKTRGDG